MQKNILGLLAACLMLCFVACGDETTVNEISSINTVASFEKLQECNDGNDGTFAYVSDSSAVFYCADGKWKTLNGKDGVDGEDGGTDTIVILKLDTVYHLDTLNQIDTIVLNSVDSIIVRDTVVGLNGESCSATDTVDAYSRNFYYTSAGVDLANQSKQFAFSVRCIKDSE